MAAQYSKHSPYYSTQTFGTFLDIMSMPAIPKDSLDVEFQIDSTYQYRPDLLASDLYGNSGLWWVFSVRNPDVLKDPIFDFYPGQKIYIPRQETLATALGI